MIAAAALLTAVVYVFTPLTAAGQEGSPTGFFTNTRYLIPGLILAMVMLPIARPLRAPGPARLADAVVPRRGLLDHRADDAEVVPDLHPRHDLHHPGAGLGAGGARRWGARAGCCRGGSWRAAGVVVLILAVVLGRAQEVQYADQHYTNTTLFLQEGGPQKAYEYAQKLQHQRIGIVGSSEIIFGQYGFFGNPPTNEVEFIGVPGPHGSYRLATSCRQFDGTDQRGQLRLPDHVRSTQDSRDRPNTGIRSTHWVKEDPALKQVVKEPEIVPQPDYVFKVEGKLSPQYCPSKQGEKEARQEAEVEEREPNG